MDGDLGPTTSSMSGCRPRTRSCSWLSRPCAAWRAIRRSRGRADFWMWLLTYRCQSRPLIRQPITAHAGDADVHVLRTPRAVRQFVATATTINSGRSAAP